MQHAFAIKHNIHKRGASSSVFMSSHSTSFASNNHNRLHNIFAITYSAIHDVSLQAKKNGTYQQRSAKPNFAWLPNNIDTPLAPPNDDNDCCLLLLVVLFTPPPTLVADVDSANAAVALIVYCFLFPSRSKMRFCTIAWDMNLTTLPMLIDDDSQLYYPCYLEQRTTSSTTTDLRFAGKRSIHTNQEAKDANNSIASLR